MSWLWLPLTLSLLVIAPFAWTIINPGKGPDGAMEASFTFMIAIIGTLVIWSIYGGVSLLMWLL